MTLVVNGEVAAGTVRAAGATYAIRWVGNGVYAIREVDPTAIPRLEGDAAQPPALPPPAPAPVEPIRPPVRSLQPSAAARPAEDGSRIDVLVVFTRKARDAAGGLRAMWAEIDLLVAETNQAYADSAVVQRVHLAHAAEVRYVEGDWNPSYIVFG